MCPPTENNDEQHQPSLDYRLLFYLKGIPKPQTFYVRESTYERLQNLLFLSVNEDISDTHYFSFYTKDGYAVAVSLKDLQAVNFAWDAPNPFRPSTLPSFDDITDDEVETRLNLQIYFRGNATPLKFSSCEPEALNLALHTFEFINMSDEDPFVNFEDEDGEELYFRLRQVVLIIVPHLLLPEENWPYFYESDISEGDESA